MKRERLDLQFPISKELKKEISCIENSFQQEVNKWRGEHTIRLLILAEAPLSCERYFYNRNRGNFLSGLRKYFNASQDDLLTVLRANGIFVLDMYKYPIRTYYYDQDGKTHSLFDPVWFCDKVKTLQNNGLINCQTRAVFRYKKLRERVEDMEKKGINIPCLQQLCFLIDSQSRRACLNKQERPAHILSDEVLAFF